MHAAGSKPTGHKVELDSGCSSVIHLLDARKDLVFCEVVEGVALYGRRHGSVTYETGPRTGFVHAAALNLLFKNLLKAKVLNDV